MRQAELLREDDAGLPEALIVGLQPYQHEIEPLALHRRGERVRHHECVGARERVALHVNAAIGAARQRFAQHLPHARRPRRADDDFSAVFFLEPQAFLERVRVRLVHLERRVLLPDPGLRLVQTRLPVAGGNLFETDSDFHP